MIPSRRTGALLVWLFSRQPGSCAASDVGLRVSAFTKLRGEEYALEHMCLELWKGQMPLKERGMVGSRRQKKTAAG